ncbi:uncharacterized protein LOC116805868 [Drosophila grimshawi]|uniref:uncharacterized protein LOC116805868 n=1 Tax=Drosophila grimshawi TaxID=7222 RepID=UPI000C86EC83|nr:uncharacterized protein LOC116805868 [Drosophila grimshawi]
MSPRLVLICLALLVLVYAPQPTSAAAFQLSGATLLERDPDTELATTVEPSSSESGQPKQRTFFLLLPLLFSNQY